MIKLFFIFILSILALCRITEKRLTSVQFKKEKGWVFVDKMVLAPGTINLQLTTKTKGNMSQSITLQFGLVSDQFFETQNKYRCQNPQQKMVLEPHVLLPNNKPTTTKINFDNHKQHLYYFILKDCDMQISNLSAKTRSSISISLSLTIVNAGSHLGSEEDMWYLYPIIIIASLWLAYRIKMQKPLQGQKNWLQIILFIGILARISGLFWKGFGFLLYWIFGKNYTVFQVFYLALHGLSEVMIICIIILIGFGWYILFSSHSEFDMFIIMLVLLGTLNIILNILNVINDNDPQKYHMYDTVPSIIQTVFRIVALISLVLGIKRIWSQLSHAKKSFMVKFFCCGIFYILSLPITLLLSKFIKNVQKQQMIFLISEVFQLSCNGIMTYFLTSKQSSYNKINVQSSSFLPANQEINTKFF